MHVSIAAPAIWKRALSIFGTEQKALRWLGTRLPELDYRTPEEVLSDRPCPDVVDEIRPHRVRRFQLALIKCRSVQACDAVPAGIESRSHSR